MFANLQPSDARNGDLYKCNMYNKFEDTTKGGSYSRITVTPSMLDFRFSIFFFQLWQLQNLQYL